MIKEIQSHNPFSQKDNDKKTLVDNYIEFEKRDIYTIHEENESSPQPKNSIEEKKEKISYFLQMLYKIFQQMVCATHIEKSSE